MSDALPPRIQGFLGAHIHSVEQLEVLLLLRAHAATEWSAHAVARELRIAESSAGGRLEDLCLRGLLTRGRDPDTLRYAAPSGELGRAVDELAQLYPQRRVSIITFIFSRPNERLRSFADAFRLKRGHTDG